MVTHFVVVKIVQNLDVVPFHIVHMASCDYISYSCKNNHKSHGSHIEFKFVKWMKNPYITKKIMTIDAIDVMWASLMIVSFVTCLRQLQVFSCVCPFKLKLVNNYLVNNFQIFC